MHFCKRLNRIRYGVLWVQMFFRIVYIGAVRRDNVQSLALLRVHYAICAPLRYHAKLTRQGESVPCAPAVFPTAPLQTGALRGAVFAIHIQGFRLRYFGSFRLYDG